MHTWILLDDGLTYSVGHYRQMGSPTSHSPSYEWVEMLTYTTQAEADSMVSYLNGGAAPAAPAAAKK